MWVIQWNETSCHGPWSMFQEAGGLYGVSERGGGILVQGSHSLWEKAVEQSGGVGSDALEPSS